MSSLLKSPGKNEQVFPRWFKRRCKINVQKKIKTRVDSGSQIINSCPTITTVKVIGFNRIAGKDSELIRDSHSC